MTGGEPIMGVAASTRSGDLYSVRKETLPDSPARHTRPRYPRKSANVAATALREVSATAGQMVCAGARLRSSIRRNVPGLRAMLSR